MGRVRCIQNPNPRTNPLPPNRPQHWTHSVVCSQFSLKNHSQNLHWHFIKHLLYILFPGPLSTISSKLLSFCHSWTKPTHQTNISKVLHIWAHIPFLNKILELGNQSSMPCIKSKTCSSYPHQDNQQIWTHFQNQTSRLSTPKSSIENHHALIIATPKKRKIMSTSCMYFSQILVFVLSSFCFTVRIVGSFENSGMHGWFVTLRYFNAIYCVIILMFGVTRQEVEVKD